MNMAIPAFRRLRFSNLDELKTEVARLVAAEAEGKLTRCGSWTLGQCLHHLASWTDFIYVGYPEALRPPLLLKLVFKVIRGKLLREPMKAGAKIPKIPGGTLATEVVPTPEAYEHFQKAIARLETTQPIHASPLFGRFTHEEAILVTLRHAELHLGFHGIRA